MQNWYIDFSGWCEIQASTREEAKEKFWELIDIGEPLPMNVFDIENVTLRLEGE